MHVVLAGSLVSFKQESFEAMRLKVQSVSASPRVETLNLECASESFPWRTCYNRLLGLISEFLI